MRENESSKKLLKQFGEPQVHTKVLNNNIFEIFYTHISHFRLFSTFAFFPIMRIVNIHCPHPDSFCQAPFFTNEISGFVRSFTSL